VTRDGASYDLIVVGGGVVGMMTALLARRRRPDLSLLVIDRSVLGLGATAYSAYLDLPFGHTESIRSLTTRSMALYRELRNELPALPIVDLPILGVCAQDGLDVARARLTDPGARLRQTGGDAVDGAAIPGAPPGFAVPSGHVVLEGMQAARCKAGLIEALAGALGVRAQDGASHCDIMEGAEVVRISSGAGAHRLDLHDGRSISGERVALCVGPWLGLVLEPMTGARVETRNKKVVSLLIPGDPPEGAPVIYLFEHEAFLMPQPEHRRWLFSFRSEEWDVVPSAAELRLSADDLARATKILELHFPRGIARPFGARVFCDAYTPTREPVTAALPGRAGVVVIGGAGGSGVRLAPAMAERGLQAIGM
jgi:glycine/D-amino acid oxidase-like deaminating enzyme